MFGKKIPWYAQSYCFAAIELVRVNASEVVQLCTSAQLGTRSTPGKWREFLLDWRGLRRE